MKQFIIQFLFVISVLVLWSCSSEEVPGRLEIDGEPATLYTGVYGYMLPGTSVPETTYSEEWTLLHDAVPVEVIAGKERTSDKREVIDANLTFNLVFSSKSAELEIDSVGHEIVVTTTTFTETYRYTPGLYNTPSRQHTGYTIHYGVGEDKIEVQYLDEGGDPMGETKILCALSDFKREDTRTVSTTVAELPFNSKYRGKFVVQCRDVTVLVNDDFTFEFNTASGQLNELKPEQKELLQLAISN